MEIKGYNDYELIYMVRESGEKSKDLLYQKYGPILISLSREYYVANKQYGAEFEDFLQEAKYSFEKALINYDEKTGVLFYTFVITCVRRRLITFSRIISSNKHKPLCYYANIDECKIPDSHNSIINFSEEYDIKQIISKMISEFPIKYSSVLELVINGFSYYEISNLLAIPYSTVQYRVKWIRQQIKKYYCKEAI